MKDKIQELINKYQDNIFYITINKKDFDMSSLNVGPDLVEGIDFKATKEITNQENETKFQIEMISEKGKQYMYG